MFRAMTMMQCTLCIVHSMQLYVSADLVYRTTNDDTSCYAMHVMNKVVHFPSEVLRLCFAYNISTTKMIGFVSKINKRIRISIDTRKNLPNDCC
jgi:hypothetical protein